MATPSRPSLAANRAEKRRAMARPILGEAQAQPVEAQAQPVEAQVQPVEAQAQGVQKSSKRQRPPRPASPGVKRTSYYLPDAEWEAARAAFLADWYAGGEASSLARWISEAMRSFARLSAKRRAGLIPDALPRAANGTARGDAHTLSLDADAVQAMKEAKIEDAAQGRKGDADSAWVRGAMAVAVSAALKREGGHLDPAPTRLPARLER